MRRSFEANLWHKVQRMRWDDLASQGWRVTSKSELQSIGVVMTSDAGFRAEFSVPRSLDIREANARLLQACEQFAGLCEVVISKTE